MSPPAVAADRVVQDFPPPLPEVTGHVAAMDRQTDAIREQTSEIRRLRLSAQAAAREVAPAIKTVRNLCVALRKWGPWVLATAPGVLVAIGAISPNAAAALKALISGAP
jgi:hypothetical protein